MISLMNEPPRPMMTPHETCGKSSLIVRVVSGTIAVVSPAAVASFCARSARATTSASEMRCCAQSSPASGPEMVATRSRVFGISSSIDEMCMRVPDSARICRSLSPPLPMTFPVSFSGSSIFMCWRSTEPSAPSATRTRLLWWSSLATESVSPTCRFPSSAASAIAPCVGWRKVVAPEDRVRARRARLK